MTHEFTSFAEWLQANKDLAPKEPGKLFRQIIEALPDHERTRGTIQSKMREAYRQGLHLSNLKELGKVEITDELVRKR